MESDALNKIAASAEYIEFLISEIEQATDIDTQLRGMKKFLRKYEENIWSLSDFINENAEIMERDQYDSLNYSHGEMCRIKHRIQCAMNVIMKGRFEA